jgi:hypothetical protein
MNDKAFVDEDRISTPMVLLSLNNVERKCSSGQKIKYKKNWQYFLTK